jgi:hypothetical protein
MGSMGAVALNKKKIISEDRFRQHARKARHMKVTRDIIKRLWYRLSCVISDYILSCLDGIRLNSVQLRLLMCGGWVKIQHRWNDAGWGNIKVFEEKPSSVPFCLPRIHKSLE